jgi:ABC-type Na+ transport system ATPase subunit NatA
MLTRFFAAVIQIPQFGPLIGEIFSLLGPNGAGKTTTISMLSCLLSPSGGEATIECLGRRLRHPPRQPGHPPDHRRRAARDRPV